MTIKFKKDENKELTVITIIGDITIDKVMVAYKKFFNNPTKNVLWDYRLHDVSDYFLESNEFKRIFEFVALNKNKRSGGKTAYVVSNAILTGMAKTIQELVKAEKLPWEMKTFKSIDEAMHWLEDDK